MNPYLAIIADSFREALASRVLWILLILITLVLAALIPLGFRTDRTTEFRPDDFVDARALVRAMQRDFERGTPSAGQRVWATWDEQTRRALSDFAREDDKNSRSYFAELPTLVKALNETLKRRDLHDARAWEGVLLGSEARELLERGIETLSGEDLARLNRLLVVLPYEQYFRPQPAQQITITYGGFRVSPPLRASEKLVRQVIEQLVLPAVISVLVGFVGVLAAILVTAPIIPQMFDPGSLSLLLSKPVARSLMFLAKFLGGCAFICINVTYLLVGLWALVGLRLGIWSQGLLLCIPIFLFLFAIYYSVSALAGVLWRNAVVCVVMTVLFWFACTAVGATKGVFEQIAVESKRLIRLVPADDTLIALDERGATHRWDAATSEWQAVFLAAAGRPGQRVLGPVYDAQHRVLLAAHAGDRGMFGSRQTLSVGRHSEGWPAINGPSLPEGTWELLPDPHGGLLAVTGTGVQRLVGDPAAQPQKLQVFFMEIPQSSGQPFRAAGPATPLKLLSPAAAAVDPLTGNIAVYSRGVLTLLAREDTDYRQAQTVSVDADPDEDALVVSAGSTVLLALADGRILNYAAPGLTLRETYCPEPGSQPRFGCAAPDGRGAAIVFHNGRLWVLAPTPGAPATLQLADVRGQGDISAVAFSADAAMLVADRVQRVTRYQWGSWEQIESHAPPLTALELAYFYAVVPLYTVFPQPGELDNTIQYLLRREETVDMGLPGGSLQDRRVRLHPWAPVRSSLVFMLVVLGAACLYIERQDF